MYLIFAVCHTTNRSRAITIIAVCLMTNYTRVITALLTWMCMLSEV